MSGDEASARHAHESRREWTNGADRRFPFELSRGLGYTRGSHPRPMTEPERPPDNDPDQRAIRRGIRGAIIFGVVAATIEMAILLWLMNC